MKSQVSAFTFMSPAQTAPVSQSSNDPYIVLLPINDTFETKTIRLPYHPEVIRIGRQTNKSTVPSCDNGFFDSKVLSRSHAEIWADGEGRICIKDIKSSNGTFINGVRLSKENEESEARELHIGDTLELGIDILNDDNGTIIHRKVSARVNHAGRGSDNRPSQHDARLNGSSKPNKQQLEDFKRLYESPGNGQNGLNLARVQTGPGGLQENTINASGAHTNGVLPSQVPTSNGRHNITVDMVIKRLNNDLKASQQVAADLRHTFELCSTRAGPSSLPSISQSPFTFPSTVARLSASLQDDGTSVGTSSTSPSSVSNGELLIGDKYKKSYDEQSARVAALEASLMEERENRMLIEEKWQALFESSSRYRDDDESSISSVQTVRDGGGAESHEVPRGTDEVSKTNGGGVIERLENMLRSSQEEALVYKTRAEAAEIENSKKTSQILQLLARTDVERTQAGSPQSLIAIATPSSNGVQQRGSKTGEVSTNDKGGRGAALVGMVGMLMLGVGIMSFLNNYGPKKDF